MSLSESNRVLLIVWVFVCGTIVLNGGFWWPGIRNPLAILFFAPPAIILLREYFRRREGHYERADQILHWAMIFIIAVFAVSIFGMALYAIGTLG